MLEELRVRNLGVVEDANLILGAGMTVITGETGAGKTLLTEAIRLLTGGKAESHMVRMGATEASIEGRFVTEQRIIDLTDDEHITDSGEDDHELVVGRLLPATGRSRAYLDGRMAPSNSLQTVGAALVDLHGQNTHQALLSSAAQRRSLDAFGTVDLGPLQAVRKQISDIDKELGGLGGDAQTRAREIDLLTFQLEELTAAQLTDADEDERLLERESLLADAESHRSAAFTLHEAIGGEGGTVESLSNALKATTGRKPLSELELRLRALVAEIDDIALESADIASGLLDDPEALAEVQGRRALLKNLQRKYGPALGDVIAFRDQSAARLADLERHDEVVVDLERRRAGLVEQQHAAEAAVGKARRAAGPDLATQVQVRLRELALPNARFEVQIGDAPDGGDVTFLLGPNPGMPLLPIAKAASGGELARSMLALRLALLNQAHGDDTPDTLIFDEVDAGIGGEAAIAVGRALSMVARGSSHSTQVLVVTHLAQVAAFADHQIVVEKMQGSDNTASMIRVLTDDEREVELARMLSGKPDSKSGRAHARELLDQAREGAPGDDVRIDGNPKKKSPKKSAVKKTAAKAS